MVRRAARHAAKVALVLATIATANWLLFTTLPAAMQPKEDPLLIVSHRGAWGYRPEHTMGAYELAVGTGADYLEWDVQPTGDGVLWLSHSAGLSHWTDVASRPEFADKYRKHKKFHEGGSYENWYMEDFTYDEFKTLRVVQRRRTRSKTFDGLYPPVTVQEGLEFVTGVNRIRALEGKGMLGLYVETKWGPFFKEMGLNVESQLVKLLADAGYTHPSAPLYLQAFQLATLKRLHELAPGVKRTWLVTQAARLPEITEAAAAGIEAIGPRISLVVNNTDHTSTGLLEQAHELGMLVHPYTVNEENEYSPGFSSPEEILTWLMEMGADGVFTDVPDVTYAVRDRWFCGKYPSSEHCLESAIMHTVPAACRVILSDARDEWATMGTMLLAGAVLALAGGRLGKAWRQASTTSPGGGDWKAFDSQTWLSNVKKLSSCSRPRQTLFWGFLVLAAVVAVSSGAALPVTMGVNGRRPANSMGAFESAVVAGVDYLHLQVQSTSDNQLVLAQAGDLAVWTDVESRVELLPLARLNGFGDRVWLVQDMTADEFTSLLLVQEDGERQPKEFDGLFFGLKLDAVLRWVRGANADRVLHGSPTLGLLVDMIPPVASEDESREEPGMMETLLVSELATAGYMNPGMPVLVASSSMESLGEIQVLADGLPLAAVIEERQGLNRIPELGQSGFSAVVVAFELVLEPELKVVEHALDAGLAVYASGVTEGVTAFEEPALGHVLELFDAGVNGVVSQVPTVTEWGRRVWFCEEEPDSDWCLLSEIQHRPAGRQPCSRMTEVDGWLWWNGKRVTVAVAFSVVVMSVSGLLTTWWMKPESSGDGWAAVGDEDEEAEDEGGSQEAQGKQV